MSSQKTNSFPLLGTRSRCSTDCVLERHRRNGRAGTSNGGSSCGSCCRLREGVVDDGTLEVFGVAEELVGADEWELRLEVLVLSTVDRPARLRPVTRQHAERRPECPMPLDVQLRALRRVLWVGDVLQLEQSRPPSYSIVTIVDGKVSVM